MRKEDDRKIRKIIGKKRKEDSLDFGVALRHETW